MEVSFADHRLEKQFENPRELERKQGAIRAKLLRKRFADLVAASSLEACRNMPGRVHELHGNREGQISIDLDGPYRLLFRPSEPIPRKTDGGIDWIFVKGIVIEEIVDTHE
jgi:plasmid maintenance system killer protein